MDYNNIKEWTSFSGFCFCFSFLFSGMALMVCGPTAKMIIRKTWMILYFVGRVPDWPRRDVVENEGSRDNNDKVRGLYDAGGIVNPEI